MEVYNIGGIISCYKGVTLKSLSFLIIFSIIFNINNVRAEESSSEEVTTVFVKHRDYLEKESVRVGSVIIDSTIENLLQYEDNVFKTGENEVSDYIYHLKPYVKATSDWQSHEIYTKFNGDFSAYNDYDGENYQDYSFGIGGRVDIDRNNNIQLNVTHHEMHEDRGSPDDVGGVAPTNFSRDEFFAKYNINSERRVSGYLEFVSEYYKYEDNTKGDGSRVYNSYRDRLETKLKARGEYEFKPDYSIFGQVSYNFKDYDQSFKTKSNGTTEPLVRDSDGYDVRTGLSSKITGKADFEVYLGYLSQDYDAETRDGISQFYGGGEMVYNITGLTSLELGYKTYVRETTIDDVSGILATRYYANLEHELTRYVLLGAYISQDESDYEYNPGIEKSREDESLNLEFKAKYFVNKSLSVEGSYKYNDYSSTDADSEFEANSLQIGLKYKF